MDKNLCELKIRRSSLDNRSVMVVCNILVVGATGEFFFLAYFKYCTVEVSD